MQAAESIFEGKFDDVKDGGDDDDDDDDVVVVEMVTLIQESNTVHRTVCVPFHLQIRNMNCTQLFWCGFRAS